MVTGTNDFQQLFQGLLAEQVVVQGEPYGVQVVKLTGDSVAQINILNALIPAAYDFIQLIYTGSLISEVFFKQGGSGGTQVARLLLVYDSSENLLTVTRQ